MTRTVVYHPRAGQDARKLADYYADISPELSQRFWAELLSAIEYAREHPERHHFDATGQRRASLTRFPVHFLFRVFPETIRVTVIRHDKRHPDFGSRRR